MMKFSIHTGDWKGMKSDLMVVFMQEGKLGVHSYTKMIDQKMVGEMSRRMRIEKFRGATGQKLLLQTHGKMNSSHILILGIGGAKKFTLEVLREGGGKVNRIAQDTHARSVGLVIGDISFNSYSISECVQSVVEGMILSSYEFTLYKKRDAKKSQILNLVIHGLQGSQNSSIQKGMRRAQVLSRGVALARDLVNAPANDCTPFDLAHHARSIKGVRTKIYQLPQIKKMKMGAFLGVAQGSVVPPAFIEMHYRPSGKAKSRVGIIGKGVTFDSGGLSLKPPKFMEKMKNDMAGAAAVIGLMSVIAQLKPKVEVWGLVAATENMPGGKAQRPGDVVRAMNGKTIEVLNTDAEGRLTLADALCYAAKKKPDYLIDLATLTGACLVALGEKITGMMGNNQELVKKLTESSIKTGEKIWELPLGEEYKDELKSPIADYKNIGGGYAGAIVAGLFLQEFVDGHPWVHLDIAGPSWTDKPGSYEVRGGTGVMVRTLADFLSRF